MIPMEMKQQHMVSFGQLTHPARLILLSLQDHPMDGRELLIFLEEGKRWLEPGTLWATINRLERAGLIFPLQADGSWQQTRRYDVTNAGLSMLSQEGNALFEASDRIGRRSSRGVLRGWLMALIKWILRLYPPAWRERYEQEMIELLSTHEITFWTWLDLLWNAINARLDPYYRRSASPEAPQRQRRVQWVIVVAFLLPLFSALFYLNFFAIGGLHADYWARNEQFSILAVIHEFGKIGVNAMMFAAWLAVIQLAYQGIKKFCRSGDALFHRLVMVIIHLPVVMLLSVVFFPFLPDAVTLTIFLGSHILMSFLLICWGVVKPEGFRRAFLYLLPWLGVNIFALTLFLGELLLPTPDNTTPSYMWFALLSLLSTPLTFVVAMIRLRLDKQVNSILLTLVTVGTLGMTLVQLMMSMRLIILHFLGLSTIWTSELIFSLTLNVFSTVLALAFLLTLLLRRRRNAPPTNPAQELVIVAL